MKTFIDIIKSKSTKELLDIYHNHYLEYQEAFIDLCAEELRQRGVEITSITLELPEELKPQIQEYMKRKLYNGESSINIARELCRYGYRKEDFEDLLGLAKHQTAIMKMEDIIQKYKRDIVLGVLCIPFSLLSLYIETSGDHSSYGPLTYLSLFVLIACLIGTPIKTILMIWYTIKIKIKKKRKIHPLPRQHQEIRHTRQLRDYSD
ncbi:MAG: hypothetical protein ACOCNA_03865 [Prevotella pectinovora]